MSITGKKCNIISVSFLYGLTSRSYELSSPKTKQKRRKHISPYAYCANNPVRFIDENEIALLLEIEWNLVLSNSLFTY